MCRPPFGRRTPTPPRNRERVGVEGRARVDCRRHHVPAGRASRIRGTFPALARGWRSCADWCQRQRQDQLAAVARHPASAGSRPALLGRRADLDRYPGLSSAAALCRHQDGVKPGLTPRETLVFWAALQGGSAPCKAAAIEVALEAFALDSVAGLPCRWLSAGQRRRLALARLVATRAPVWLLDEPTSALDADNQARLERIIAEHRAGGGRLVVASHTPIRMDGAEILGLSAFAPALADADEF